MNQELTPLFDTAGIRHLEKRIMGTYGMDTWQLMQYAAGALWTFIQKNYSDISQVALFCGSGNNGGDGAMLAYLLALSGKKVHLYQRVSATLLKEPAKHAMLMAESVDVEIHALNDPLYPETELIIDALLGTGFKGTLSEDIAHAIITMNSSFIPVISVDVPSGLNVDTGSVESIAVKATHTVTLIGSKQGLYTLDGSDYTGQVHIAPLFSEVNYEWDKHGVFLLDKAAAAPLIKVRNNNSNKRDFGRILVVGGGLGMPGAPYLAAKSALRVGAGLVMVATRPEYEAHGLSFLPEALSYGIDSKEALRPLLSSADVCIFGPGLGTDEWAMELFHEVLASQLPMVIDASALRLLALYPQADDNWVLTPHPGEAAAMLHVTTDDIQADRFDAVSAIQQQYGGVVALKGNGTLVLGDKLWVCPYGNPSMATAGTGDILSGMIGGFLAQHNTLEEAAMLGVYTHAKAGDRWQEQHGACGLLASELTLV